MKINNNLMSFSDFSSSSRLDEMASSLTKLGVPKSMAQFIHKLEGKKFKPSEADKQLNPQTGKLDVEFHTALAPYASKKGPWPAREDVPLSHDVQVQGTKTGKRNIQHYLEVVVPKNKDTDIRLILVTPSADHISYLDRKTGKTPLEFRKRKYGSGLSDKQLRDASRFDPDQPVAEKTGMYMRGITIDADSGEPVSQWIGTIGQMIAAGYVAEDSTLYIMEKEDRVRAKRGKRKSIKEVTEDQFLDYFKKNFENIASKFMGRSATKAREDWKKKMSELEPEDFETKDIYSGGRYRSIQVPKDTEVNDEFDKLRKIMASSKFDINMLKPKLNNFLELAKKEGEYEPDETRIHKDRASLTNMVEVHTLPVVASMFLQYAALGKVSKPFHTDDPFKELGLEDLF